MGPARVAAGVLVAMAVLAGGLLAAKPAAPAKPRPPLLPSWAPKQPSPELLRAAKVLKPIPEEVATYTPLLLASWEFFGSLTDAQVADFRKLHQYVDSVKALGPKEAESMKTNSGAVERDGKLTYWVHQVWVPMRSLTAPQRRGFDNIVKAWPESIRHGEKDLVVGLYRGGARRDLSNVDIGFTSLGHGVYLNFRVKSPGHPYSSYSVWIAQL